MPSRQRNYQQVDFHPTEGPCTGECEQRATHARAIVLAEANEALQSATALRTVRILEMDHVKVIAGTVLIIGLIISLFEKWFSPNVLVTEDSPNFPGWLGWLAWGLAALAAVVYVSVDVMEWRRHG